MKLILVLVSAVALLAGTVWYTNYPHASTEVLLQDQVQLGDATVTKLAAGPWDNHPLNLNVFGDRIPYDESDRTLSMLQDDDDDAHPVHGKFHSYSKDALELNLAEVPDAKALFTESTKDVVQPYMETETKFGPNHMTDPVLIKNHYIVEFKVGISQDCKTKVWEFLGGKDKSAAAESTWCAKNLRLGRKLNLINAFAMVSTRNRLLRCVERSAAPITCSDVAGKSVTSPLSNMIFAVDLNREVIGDVIPSEDRLLRMSLLEKKPEAYTGQWNLDRIDDDKCCGSGHAYNIQGGEGVTVYIADTGINVGHDTFGGRARLGFSAVGGDAGDENGHGTHCAGTCCGNGFGVANKAKVVAVRVLNAVAYGTSAQVLSGYEWAIQDAKSHGGPSIVSASLGDVKSRADDEAAMAVVNNGIPMVVAAGNNNGPACERSPSAMGGISRPVVTVGSTDRQDIKSSFSNYGSCVDIFAPGSDIRSSWVGGASAAKTISGTSMACPAVSGVAALYLSKFKDATPWEVKNSLIMQSVPGLLQLMPDHTPNRMLHADADPPRAPASVPATRSPTNVPTNTDGSTPPPTRGGDPNCFDEWDTCSTWACTQPVGSNARTSAETYCPKTCGICVSKVSAPDPLFGMTYSPDEEVDTVSVGAIGDATAHAPPTYVCADMKNNELEKLTGISGISCTHAAAQNACDAVEKLRESCCKSCPTTAPPTAEPVPPPPTGAPVRPPTPPPVRSIPTSSNNRAFNSAISGGFRG